MSICYEDGHLRSAEFDQRTRQIPWQQFRDAVDRVIGDPPQHLAQIEFWIEPVELGCSCLGCLGIFRTLHHRGGEYLDELKIGRDEDEGISAARDLRRFGR